MSEEKIINFANAKAELNYKKLVKIAQDIDPTNITGKYILVDKVPVPEPNLIKWSQWLNEPVKNRIIKQQLITVGKRIWGVSTIFLAIDYSFSRDGDPILFETMIFNHTKGKRRKLRCDFQERYSTYEEAEKGHEKVVADLAVITACPRKLKKLKRKGLA